MENSKYQLFAAGVLSFFAVAMTAPDEEALAPEQAALAQEEAAPAPAAQEQVVPAQEQAALAQAPPAPEQEASLELLITKRKATQYREELAILKYKKSQLSISDPAVIAERKRKLAAYDAANPLPVRSKFRRLLAAQGRQMRAAVAAEGVGTRAAVAAEGIETRAAVAAEGWKTRTEDAACNVEASSEQTSIFRASQGQNLYIMERSDMPGVLKIGRSDNPAKRAASLQCGHCFWVKVLATFPDAGCKEHAIHSALECYRVPEGPGTEWFRVPFAMALETVVAMHGGQGGGQGGGSGNAA